MENNLVISCDDPSKVRLFRKDFKVILWKLCNKFNVSYPTLKINTNYGYCCYYHGQQIIVISGAHIYRLDKCLLHEFAHHLNSIKDMRCGHGETYWKRLLEVVTFYYQDPKLYPWHKEAYQTGREFAKKLGLLAP